MKPFFSLQLKRWHRYLIALGIHPIIGIIIIPFLFIGMSQYLFYKTEFAPWLYMLIAFSILLNHGQGSRISILKGMLNKPQFTLVRLVENATTAIPFAAYLIFKNEGWLAVFLLLISIGMPYIPLSSQARFTIPTPFKQRPFEFIIGFRKYFWLYALLVFIFFKGIQVGNETLSLVSIGAVYLMIMAYVGFIESTYFVWIYAFESKPFLHHKIKYGLINTAILTLPMSLLFYAFYSHQGIALILLTTVGIIWVIMMICAKYSVFPRTLNLPQAILIGLCLWFPPIILIILPIFYTKALKNLRLQLL